jgi:hypothetical protein
LIGLAPPVIVRTSAWSCVPVVIPPE